MPRRKSPQSKVKAPAESLGWLQDYLHRRPEAKTPELAEALAQVGLGARQSRSKKVSVSSGPDAPKARRRGVDVHPIVASLVGAPVRARACLEGPASLSLWFEGARALTVNELISVLQVRMHDTFRYKKAWKELVLRALDALDPTVRAQLMFDGPTRLTLYRRGARQVDLDSLSTLFKYALDSLRRTKKNPGVLEDDNPNIVVEIVVLQDVGSPALALRLDALPDWVRPDTSALEAVWFPDP